MCLYVVMVTSGSQTIEVIILQDYWRNLKYSTETGEATICVAVSAASLLLPQLHPNQTWLTSRLILADKLGCFIFGFSLSKHSQKLSVSMTVKEVGAYLGAVQRGWPVMMEGAQILCNSFFLCWKPKPCVLMKTFKLSLKLWQVKLTYRI